jgi:sugar phosphate isomerase/epimerase
MSKLSFILCDPIESFGDMSDFATVLRSLKRIGFGGVEFNLTPSVVSRSEQLLHMVEEIELPVVSFLTGTNYFGQGLCLCSPDDEIRRKAIETLCQFTATAAKFGAILVVGQMQGFRSDEPDRDLAVERIESALRQVAQSAEENGTTVVLEPVNHLQCGFHNTLEAVMNLTDRVGSLRLKPMLDSFHMNIEERSMKEPITRVGKDLAHFHLCESNGGFLGSGHLDIPAIFEALDSGGYRGVVSVKVYREAWETAARATMEYFKSIGQA